MRRRAAGLLVATVLAGCTQVVPGHPVVVPAGNRALVLDYFAAGNEAAQRGSDALARFLDDTQHPDFRDSRCPLGGLTQQVDPTVSTLRPDPDWSPPGADAPPRGTVYVVAVTVTVLSDGVVLATQIGSQHVVVLDGTAYGFAPCTV